MGNSDAIKTQSKSRANEKNQISLASLIGIDDESAEALVCSASPSEKQQVLAEFVAYHQDCLLSTSRVDPMAVSDLIRFTKTCVLQIDFTLAVSRLIEISSYYENAGDIDNAVLVAEESLRYAATTSDKALQRKAYSRLGASYSRQFDFERSCFCYENALKLAIAVGDPLYEFAVLSNVVTLFDAMGLRREAIELAQKLFLIYPGGSKELDLLHLQNSINGYKFAAALNNAFAMKRFQACALRKMRSVREVPAIWKAYLEANTITDLLHRGKAEEAKRRVEKWANRETTKSNSRVAVCLLSASVECAILLADKTWLERLESSLLNALPLSKSYPPDYELLLSLLARVHEQKVGSREDSTSDSYARRLQDHVVNVRHRQFFSGLSRRNLLDDVSIPTLANPLYELTSSMFDGGDRLDATSATSVTSTHRSDDSFADLEGQISRTHALAKERHLRSPEYCIAENWAVAAEFGSYGDGAHCFLVGALAHKIGAELNLSADECIALELACRLHDIGKIGVPVSLAQRVPTTEWHNSLYLREHSIIGARLLQSSKDGVLALASIIARSHHEWWNGFGYPDALAAAEIPIESRICAVASEYAALTGSKDSELTWSHQEAINQITTMAGVQFDPIVVQAFLKVDMNSDCLNSYCDSTRKLEANSLKIAKVRLDTCVSSI